jgi:FAD/FMN-containing dehydrogenase
VSLAKELARSGIDVSDDLVRRRAASADFAWLSPVLQRRLPGEPADVVAWPRDGDELAACVAVAHRHEVPVTPRGRGTGNYGQAVPLRRGLVIDCTRMRRVLAVDDGWARVEPGVTCAALEGAARRSGQELALFPSTTQSTIGGFLAGGAGGSGSIDHGLLWEGFVASVDVLACVDAPGVEHVSGSATRPFLHAYGTTGVLAGARIRLDRAREWTGVIASFEDFGAGAAAGNRLLDASVPLRLLGVSEADLVANFPPRPFLPPDRASLRCVTPTGTVSAVIDMLAGGGGRVEGEGPRLVPVVTSLSYNHVTLRAKQADPAICHLQVSGPVLSDDPDAVRRCLPDGRLHLDAMRAGGVVGFGGLLISRFEAEPLLREGVIALTELGVHVVDPHTWSVWDGDGSVARTARRMDPDGLLNPGKLER